MFSRFDVGEYWIESVGEGVIGMEPWTVVELKQDDERVTQYWATSYRRSCHHNRVHLVAENNAKYFL